MSYDVWVEQGSGGPAPVRIGDWTYTCNVAPMLRAVIDHDGTTGLAALDGMPGEQVASHLRLAVRRLGAEPERFNAMNPANGWGSRETLVDALGSLVDLCAAHPLATFRVQ